jgi:hypothetical protein
VITAAALGSIIGDNVGYWLVILRQNISLIFSI